MLPKASPTSVLAWHFCGATLRDGRPIPPAGEWLEHTGPLVMCVSGLHASRRPAEALRYAPGATICLVECDDVTLSPDKLVCRRRRILARIDATTLLRRFACDQVLAVLPANASAIVREYLATADESKWDAARDAAWDAARDAARAAAWDAARDVAWTEFDRRVYDAFGVEPTA